MLNRLLRYGTAKNTTEFYTEWFSVCRNIISKFRIIAIFKSLAKQNNDQIKLPDMSIIFNCIKLHLSKCRGSWVVSIKQNINFNFESPSTFMFLVYHKNGIKKFFNIWRSISIQWPQYFLAGEEASGTGERTPLCVYAIAGAGQWRLTTKR
jgi:hypothetical protein